MNDLFSSRKFRVGSVATAITVLVVAVVVVLNMVVSTLTSRFSLKADLTADKLFGITDATVTYIKGLQKDVTIFVLNNESAFSSGDQYMKQANEVIRKYDLESSRITVTYIDLVRNPGFAADFPEESLAVNGILVVCEGRARMLTPYDLFNIDSYYYTVTSSRAEQALTSAIAGVVSDKVVTVAILGGHNEGQFVGMRSLLELNNYQLVEVNMLAEDIPPEADVAVLYAPLRDYTEEELEKLDRFLFNDGALGKTLFYFGAIDQGPTPNLDAFLADWNIQVGDGVVFDTNPNRFFSGNRYYPIVDYAENTFSASLLSKNLGMIVPIARPVYNLGTDADRTVITLVQFSETSGLQPLDVPETWQPTEADMIGPIPAIVLSSQSKYEDGQYSASNVVVTGTSLTVEDVFLSSTVIGNSEYYLNLFGELSQRAQTINIESKNMTSAQMGLTGFQMILYSALFVLILPLGMLIAGLTVFFRRRHM